jgi:Ribosomal protein L10
VPDTSKKYLLSSGFCHRVLSARRGVVSFWVYPDKTPGVKPMALGLEDKKAIVAEVTEAAKGALSAVAADSRGVTVTKMTALRKSAREAGVYMRVVRNTLLTRAVEGSDFECMKDVFVGPTLIAFSNEHPGAAARLFKEFAKANDKFSIKGGAFQGEFIPAAQIDRLATLPTYEEALAKMMATMKEAAAGKLVRTFAALRDKKEAEAA